MRIVIDIELDEREVSALKRITERKNRSLKVRHSEARVAGEIVKTILSRMRSDHNAILGIMSIRKD